MATCSAQLHPRGSGRGPVLGQPRRGSLSVLRAPPHSRLCDVGPQQPPSAMGGLGCLLLSLPPPPRARLSRRSRSGVHSGFTHAWHPHVPRGCRGPQLRRLRPLQLSLVTVTTLSKGASHPTEAPSNPLLLSKGFGLGTTGIFVHTGLQREAGDQGHTGQSLLEGH